MAEKGIDEMCEDAWRWQSNNPNGYVSEEIINSNEKPRRSEVFL